MIYPIQAVNFAKKYIKNMQVQKVSLDIINLVNQKMWMAAPFRWTVGSSPVILLTENNAEYSMDYPSDWLYGLQATITDSGDIHKKDLDILSGIPIDVGRYGTVSSIAYLGSHGQSSGPVRINPIPTDVSLGDKVIGLYKKTCPLVTASNKYNTPLQIPDEWFPVFQAGVLWLGYAFADDSRAGGVTVNPNGANYTGFRGEFEAGIEQMRLREKVLRNSLEQESKNVNL